MNIPGLDSLRRYVPGLDRSWGLWRYPLAMLSVFCATTVFFIAADSGFAEWMPDGEIVVLAIGFLLLSRFFSQREVYIHRYSQRAFQLAFTRFSVPGLGIIGASLAHLGYIAGPDLPGVWWKPWLQTLGWLSLFWGIALWLRGVSALGIDSLTMLYVYHPEEGRMIGTTIYGLIRHPVYSAALDIGFGLALIHANWYAWLVALLLPIFFFGWVRLVEEPELIRRFPSYSEYRRRVPAFWPRIARLPSFLRFLALGRQ